MIKIAHFGTFDVDNYGDLLFPHIAEFRLPQYLWQHVSPTDNLTVFKDAKPIISFDSAIKNKYDAVIIGGGNILHFEQNKNTVYSKEDGFAYADLWVGSSKLAMEQKIPFVFNAPGISKNVSHFFQKKIALSVFKNSNYVAFRERLSGEIAETISNGNEESAFDYNIIPDTAFDIDRMWPLDNNEFPKYISVNLNKRYHRPVDNTANYLDNISKEFSMPIKLIIIGDCHGDLEFTKKVADKMKMKKEIFSSDSLRELASTIGNSSYFLGSSMHGFITALSYGVPALLVLNKKPLHKFKGLLELTDINYNVVCDSFMEARTKWHSPAVLKEPVKQSIQLQLDNHWEKIETIINSGESLGVSKPVLKYHQLLKLQLRFNKFRGWIKF